LLATIRLFVHPAAQATNYLGFMRAPFLEGGSNRIGEVNATVKPGGDPVGVTVAGRITATPGVYPFSISIEATQSAGEDPQRLAEGVRVIVK
jgi:hypothetical protein